MKIIEVKELKKEFKYKGKDTSGKKQTFSTLAVDNVSFSVEQGDIVGFIGPNGAGKSTTIKILTGILHPDGGEASVCGYTPWKQRTKMAYKIATMFGQKSQLLPHLPVIDSYKLLGAIYDIDKTVLNEIVEEIVNFFEIHDLIHKPAGSLSLGQRMICEVAAVTLHRPDVIFFDEPTIGLDIVVKKKVRDMILSLNKNFGTTIFITSHDISDIEHLCNRIILINHGKVMLDESIAQVKSTLLTRRHVTAYYEGNINCSNSKELFSGLNVYAHCLEDNIKVDFDTRNISIGEVIQKLVSLGNVIDISISSTSLENVIYDIYTTKEGDL